MTTRLRLGIGASVASLALAGLMVFAAQQVSADTTAIDFESYSLGTVNGQDGWTSTGAAGGGCATYDHAITTNTYGFAELGTKVLRISNAVTSGCFGDQTFSKSLVNEAGEADSTSGGMSGGTRQARFEAEFDFTSTQSTQQPGLFVSVSPDRGDGSRMSYLGFSDAAGGIDVTFYDVQGTDNPANFVPTVIATGLSRTEVHTAKFVIDYADGASNDVVKIYIDGVLVHTGTTWENYYRYDSEASAEQSPRTTDDLIFRTGGSAAPATAGNGFIFDNLSTLSGPLPPVKVTIKKYIGDSAAEAAETGSASFPMNSSWDAENIGAGSGSYPLGPVGFNSPDPYTAVTSDMTSGADYSTYEVTGGPLVGADCSGGQPYTLVGYTTGDSLAEAEGAEPSLTAPSFTGLTSDKFVIVWNEACTSTVTLCKYDAAENPLEGWTLMLKGETVQDDLIVPTNTSSGINSDPLAAGISYIAESLGTWLNQGGANPVDTEYSTTDGWATQMDGYTGYQTDILELQIDQSFDPNSDWGAYNSSHAYARSFTVASDGPANFRIFDGTGTTQNEGWFGDNSGTLTVDISKGYAGITGEDGCVTFNDVPRGEYAVGEIMQDGWQNVSGLGAVVVDALTHTFNVVNEPPFLKVHILKYLDGSMATDASANGYEFPMTATWQTANLNGGAETSGSYVLGNNHGGAADEYGADTSPMYAPADYTTAEVTSGDSLVLPVGAECEYGKYRLIGYSTSSTSFADAAGNPVSATAPDFEDLVSDRYVIVHNEACPLPPPPADACDYEEAPVGYTLQDGTPGHDTVTLAPFTMFRGLGGNDKVSGSGNGNYIVCTEGGNDTITLPHGDMTVSAGAGNNKVTMGDGDATILAGNNNDTIVTGDGDHVIVLGNGNNKVTTGNGVQNVTTGTGNDTVTTGSGADTVSAGEGNNKVLSGAGNDTITAGAGNDTVNAGAGASDSCSVGGGANTVLNCEL